MRTSLPGALRKGLGLTLIGAALAVVPPASAGPVAAAPQDPPVRQQMRDEARGTVTFTESPATGRVGLVRASDDLFPSRSITRSANDAATKASAYVEKYARAFGGRGTELSRDAVTETPAGHTVDFVQTYRGLPVFASRLRAQVDRQGDLTAVGGFVAPDVEVATTPRIDEGTAVATVRRMVAAGPAGERRATRRGVAPAALSVTRAELSIYRMGAIRGVSGRNLLAWVIEVTDGRQVRETVVVDALTGKPLNRYSMVAHDLDRELIERFDDPDLAPVTVWKEGDPWPTSRAGGVLDTDQQNEVQGTGEAYWFFRNSFGRDSYDGAGAPMITVNNDPSIQCPNANWNGVSTNYCSGVSSDDTVAHEWGHAYTEHTSGLLYQWQPGAMNEAFSDIWGETVDMLNDRYNETPDTKRPVGDCSLHSDGMPISIRIVSPEQIAGRCLAVRASGGPAFPEEATDVTLVVGRDAGAEGTSNLPTDGCSSFFNAAEIAGHWVYVDENLATGCGAPTLEAYYEGLGNNAVAAGAVGLVVGGDPRFAPWEMPGATFSIPAAQVDGDSGAAIRSVTGPVTLRVRGAQPTAVTDSYRWLSGEGDPAFGGAIRDMWNPTCYGDPGKVSDEEYQCETGDSGGVHTNSGVVNHAYALLVDGGSYNGVTVPGIGLDKAANIFWHAQQSLLTPTSGFAELADGLEASCTALTTAVGLKALAIGTSPTGGAEVAAPPLAPITTADCDAVAAAALATELREEPVQCAFGPLLAAGTVGCGPGTLTATAWSEEFESAGLPAGWTLDVDAANAHIDPVVTTDLPEVSPGGIAHEGGPGVLYFNDRGSFGSCLGDAQDYSSRVSLSTPSRVVPGGAAVHLSFDHYVATEVGYDGGNVKVSVNGAAYQPVPDAAWLHNAPGGQLATAAEQNTNPMAGERAFTGTDGGSVTGAWGTSVVDVSAIADPGDSVRFRFDFGMDGCNGVDGWYVDNVELTVCSLPATAPGPVRNLAAAWQSSTQRVGVTWDEPADAETAAITGYEVAVDGGAAIPVPAETTSLDSLDLEPGSHEVAVVAINGSGPSTPLSVTVVVPDRPGPATGLTATWQAGSGTVRASWQAPDDDGGTPLTGYEVSFDGAAPVAVDATTTSLESAPVGPGAHQVSVVAVNAAGKSDPVTTSVVVAAPPSPGTAAIAPKASARKGIVRISVTTTSNAAPTGPVTVTIKGRTYVGPVVDGVLRVKARRHLRKLWRQGVRKVSATVSYPGDAKVAAFAGKVTIKLKGRQ